MFNAKLLAAMSIGLIAAACSGPYDRQAPVPANVSRTYVPDRAPAPAPDAYVAPRTTGTEASRDEYGFRYDAEGNRIDRNGHIISPQSTTP